MLGPQITLTVAVQGDAMVQQSACSGRALYEINYPDNRCGNPGACAVDGPFVLQTSTAKAKDRS